MSVEDTDVSLQLVLDLERKFNLEPSSHHDLSTRLKEELDRFALEDVKDSPISLNDILVYLYHQRKQIHSEIYNLKSKTYSKPKYFYTQSGKDELRSLDTTKENMRLDAVEDGRFDQTLKGFTVDSIISLTTQSNIITKAYWSPRDLSNSDQIKQLAEDNTDLSIQALYKQKELREIRDKIRKRRIDVNASTKDLQTITRGLVSLDKVRESKVKGKFTPKQWQEYDTIIKELKLNIQKNMRKKFIIQHAILYWQPYWSESPKYVKRMLKMCDEGRLVQ
ncbi:hypothetical protein E3P86_01814 [Wallemia ichthyophaga]|uniref:Uncharacterized protein n=1 Tax=Wallemia ichthyophaga TaxID=245174 RepID=A0A4V4M5Q8_WALIC|nr:hypothetical protein E3P86_01814 [Wallemia ichthyophaga]